MCYNNYVCTFALNVGIHIEFGQLNNLHFQVSVRTFLTYFFTQDKSLAIFSLVQVKSQERYKGIGNFVTAGVIYIGGRLPILGRTVDALCVIDDALI